MLNVELIYHRLAVRDVREVLDYYDNEAGSHLADRFYEDLMAVIGKIQTNPRHFPPLVYTRLRRGNLTNFPYHVIYEECAGVIKVMVVRHHRRNPLYGLRRQ